MSRQKCLIELPSATESELPLLLTHLLAATSDDAAVIDSNARLQSEEQSAKKELEHFRFIVTVLRYKLPETYSRATTLLEPKSYGDNNAQYKYVYAYI